MSTAGTIAWLLATRRSSPFHARANLAVVPNVSWGLLPWEADLLALTRARYLSEIEIKVSLSDWKADPFKSKWRAGFKQWDMIKSFWYAAPPKLAERHAEIEGLRPGYGVIAVADNDIRVVKSPEPNRSARKLTDAETLQLCRLGAIKAWKRAHKSEADEPRHALAEAQA